jgi:tRNA-2-methylthio-N6-dimethylallyladenosine synthase
MQEEISAHINSALLGKTVEVLTENIAKGRWQGRTRSDKIVFFSGGSNLPGKLVTVCIEKAGSWSLQGKFQSIISKY